MTWTSSHIVDKFVSLFSKTLLFRARHILYNVDHTTAFHTVFCFLLKCTNPLYFITSSTEPKLTLLIFHQSRTFFHPCETRPHLKKQWSIVSTSSSQWGQSIESISNPMWSSQKRTGILPWFRRQIKLETFLGMILHHLVSYHVLDPWRIFSSITSLNLFTVKNPFSSRFQLHVSGYPTLRANEWIKAVISTSSPATLPLIPLSHSHDHSNPPSLYTRLSATVTTFPLTNLNSLVNYSLSMRYQTQFAIIRKYRSSRYPCFLVCFISILWNMQQIEIQLVKLLRTIYQVFGFWI